MPVGKGFLQLGDFRELLMAYRGGGVFYFAGDKVESMDDATSLTDCGMG